MTEPSQLALPGSTWLERIPPELRAAYEAAAAHVANPHSDNTQKAYTAAWEQWAAHCRVVGVPSLPVSAPHLCGFLHHLGTLAAPNTVRLKLAALCAIDQGDAVATGDTDRPPLRRNALVQRWLKGWGRTHPAAPRKQAPAMGARDLVHVLQVAAEPGFNQSRPAHATRYARDKCILTLGISAGLRASELAALDVADVALSARGLTVTVRKSKGDQHGLSKAKGVLPQAFRATCPIEALTEWLRVRGAEPGPLFVGVLRGGALDDARLTKGQLERVVLERLRGAGVDGATSHSMRATCGTLLKDKPLSAVMDHVGWKSPRIALGYQRRGKLLDADGVTSGLFEER